LEISDVLATSF